MIGREFRLELVEELLDTSEDKLLNAVEEAVAAGLLREVQEDVDRFLFSHALVREAVYERQSAARRVRLHRRIGEALETLGAPPAELAYHFVEGRRDPEKAARYAEQAAVEAVESLAYEEAAEHYRRALSVAEDPERRSALLLELGRAEVRAGSPSARATLQEAAAVARAAGLPDRVALAALALAHRYAEGSALDTEGVALIEEGARRGRRGRQPARGAAARRAVERPALPPPGRAHRPAVGAGAGDGPPRRRSAGARGRARGPPHRALRHRAPRGAPDALRGAARARAAAAATESSRRSPCTGAPTTSSRRSGWTTRTRRTRSWRSSPSACASRSTSTSRPAGTPSGRSARATTSRPSS